MTLEYRCSNCGTLLQTTNADAVDAEIERLNRDVEFWKNERDVSVNHAVTFGPEIAKRGAEIERLQAANRRWSKVADERSKENVALRQENERLRAALESLTKDPPPTLFREPDTDCEVIQKMRAIAREAIDHGLPKQTPQAFVEAKADRDAGWPRDFEQRADGEKQ